MIQKEEVDNFDMQKVFMKDSSNEESASKKFTRGISKTKTGLAIVEAMKDSVAQKKEEERKEGEAKEGEEKKEGEEGSPEQEKAEDEPEEEMKL